MIFLRGVRWDPDPRTAEGRASGRRNGGGLPAVLSARWFCWRPDLSKSDIRYYICKRLDVVHEDCREGREQRPLEQVFHVDRETAASSDRLCPPQQLCRSRSRSQSTREQKATRILAIRSALPHQLVSRRTGNNTAAGKGSDRSTWHHHSPSRSRR